MTTANTITEGIRQAARVLVLDAADRVLYLHAQETWSGHRFWVLPGGGIEPGETFAQAAARELLEETGLSAEIGPCLWTRHSRYNWNGKPAEQYERFYVARVPGHAPEPIGLAADQYVIGYRWWTLEEIAASDESFAPGNIAQLLPPVLARNYPETPFDCGD